MLPLLFIGAVSFAVAPVPLARAQFSNITCSPAHAWMTNSRGQNPCLVTAYLLVPCVGETAALDIPLAHPGQFYDGPLFGPDQCSCNTVMYSMLEACQVCQFDVGEDPQPWSAWSTNCTQTEIASYPLAIPPGTAIPAWAYLDVVHSDKFNETAARLVADANVPESTAVSSSSSSATSTTVTFSTNSTTSQPTSSTASASSLAGAVSAAKSNNAGPIAAGVVGGVLGLLIGTIVFYILLRHRRLTNAAQAEVRHAASASEMTSGSGTPGPYGHMSALRDKMSPTDSAVYDPDDPRTFPPDRSIIGQMRTGGTPDGHMRETSLSPGYASSLGYRPSVVGSIYRGAPEVLA